jgi:hypothetical protein
MKDKQGNTTGNLHKIPAWGIPPWGSQYKSGIFC